MTTTGWAWANLTDEQLGRVALAEKTLGADYLLAYQPLASEGPSASATPPQGLRPAPLSESELECLAGLEAQLGAVIIAYAA